MSKNLMPSIALLSVLALGSCDSGVTRPEASPGVDVPEPLLAPAQNQAADAIEARFDGSNPAFPEPPPGNAVLGADMVRNGNNVRVRMTATATVPNTATIWAVIFNDYEECEQLPGEPVPCGADDLGNPDVNASIVRAAGRVIGSSPLVMTGHVREGDTSEALFGPGLVDAETGEIHFIFRIHGVPIPGMTSEQIHTVGGGCGVNTCYDVGAAIFLGS